MQFVPRSQLEKNGNMLLKTGSSSALSESGAKSQIAYCPELCHVIFAISSNFLHILQSENIDIRKSDHSELWLLG